MSHVWHQRMATSNVSYAKFSDSRTATLVVKHDNFFWDDKFQFFSRISFFFSEGNFSIVKSVKTGVLHAVRAALII